MGRLDSTNGSDSWNISLTNVANGASNKLFFAAVDIMGNVTTTAAEKTVKVDATEPDISDFKYAIANASSSPIINTVYLNRKEGNTLTIYGKYEDDLSLVDLGELKFAVSGETVTPTTLTFYSDSAYSTEINTSTTTKTQTAYWKAVFSKDLVEGNLSVSGYNGAGAVKTSSICTVSVDTDNPSASNIKLSDSYQQSEGSSYYINNTNKTFTISGRAADDSSAVKSVTLAITNTAVASDYDIKDDEGNVTTPGTKPADIIKNTYTGTATNWKFEGIDIKNWKVGATATITITDLAGNTNTKDEVLNILFDSLAPSTTHKIDDSQKNLEFRIGDAPNDLGELDVGGKYSNGSYGSALTMTLRGNFPDNAGGSGINKFYYKVFRDEVTINSSKTNGSTEDGKIYFKTLDKLKEHVIANKEDVFYPLDTPETKNVEYNMTPADPVTKTIGRFGDSPELVNGYTVNSKGYVQFRTSVSTNFKTIMKGFQEGKNYLVIVAEDNVGNTAVDSANIGGVEYPCYSLNVDITAPSIPTKQEKSVFTNLEEKNGVVISGTVSDKPNVANGSSGLSKIILTRDGGTGSVEVTNFTDVTAAERTAAGTAYSSDTTLKHWEEDISSLLPSTGMAIISAKVIDNAGFETSTTVATITVDKAAPNVKINSPAANAKVKQTFTISGTADDVNGAGIDTTEGMTLYYTTKEALGTVASAPVNITAGTDPTASWVAYTTAPELDGADWTVDFAVPDSIAQNSENSAVYFTVSAKDKSGTGNVSYVLPRKITVDRKMPEYDKAYSELSIGGKSHTEMTAATTPWFKDDTLVVKGKFKDEGGSGVTKIFYQVDSNTAVELATTDGTYNTNISGFGANSTLKIWAEDAAGNNTSANPETYTIQVDTTAPNLTETGVGTTGKTTNSTITLTGKAWDTNELDRIEISDGTKTWKSTDTGSNITLTKKTADPGENQTNWSASFVVGSDNSTAANYIADGTKEFTIIAYDVAGNSKQLSRTVVVDTVSPTCGTPSITSSKNTVDGKDWYKSSFIDIELKNVTDGTNGTGISKVEYTLDNTTWYPMSGSGTYTATVNCASQGKNTISVRVSDAAGNVKSAGSLEPYVDTYEPSLENSYVKYLDGDYEAVSELLINGAEGYSIKITAKDEDGGTGDDAGNNSGIASVQYSYIDSTKTTYTIDGEEPESGNDWIITIPKDGNGINKYSDSNKIYVIIKDKAGNEIKERILSVTKDSEDPTVEIKSLTRAGSQTNSIDDVNGTITISGLADDTNKFGSVKLEYLEYELKDNSWTPKQKQDETETKVDDWKPIPMTSKTSWTATLDTTGLTDKTKYTIRATATDAAGNTATDTQDVYVNQDSDRPVITLTNLVIAATSYLKSTSKLEGTISDDDGNVNELYYSTNGTDFTEITLQYGTAWNIPGLEEGDNTIYFKVKDAKDTVFTTVVQNEAATAEVETQPKIKDSSQSNTYVTHTKGSLALKFKVVTKKPDVQNQKYSVYNSTEDKWEDRASIGILGGIYTKFKVSLDAKAVSSIANVTAKYNNIDYTFNCSASHNDGNWHTWESVEIPVVTGKTNVKLTIADASDENDPMTTEQTFDFSIDNTPPKIKIKEPSSTAGVKETMQFDLSEDATAYYAVTRKYKLNDQGVETTTECTAEDVAEWTLIQETSNGLTRYVFFDDDLNEKDHTERFALYLTETSTNSKHLGITTLSLIEAITNPYETITPVKFWVKAVDSCGNTATKDQLVNVDPQGNRPTVTLGYPIDVLKKDSNTEYEHPTLGGTIRMDGNVSDDIAAKYVWVQIERGGIAFSVADLQFLSTERYPIGDMNTNNLVDDGDIQALTAGTEAATYAIANYAIRVEPIGTSWNLSINSNQEFNVDNDIANLKFKIYATDADPDKVTPGIYHIHRSGVVEQEIKIDSRTPYISASELKLVKYESASTSEKQYKEDTSVHGIWYLQGTIRDDDSGLKLIKYKRNSDNYTSETEVIKSAGTEWTSESDEHFYFKKVAHGTTGDDASKFNYEFSVPLGNNTSGQVGKDKITIYAEEATDQNYKVEQSYTVTYDNMAPVFKTDDSPFIKLSSNIYNSSGFYTFGAIASEDEVKVNGVDVPQSGVERIAFYFTRDLNYGLNELDSAVYTKHSGTTTKDLFDVMIYHSNVDADDVASGNMIVGYNSLTYSDGLYWRTYSGTSSGKTFTYTNNSVDPNIHAGGLVKINGVIYKIKSVSGKTITVGSDITGTSADFALCNVIDNSGEKNGTLISSDHGYGFGYYGTRATDDGDLITETFNAQNSEWIFDASINSKNLPDGPITLHMVAFDKAGNVTTTPYTMNGTVQNNAPRIAGLIIGTDENGNGSVDSGEFINAYSNKFVKGYDTAGNEMHDAIFPVTPTGEEQKSLLTVKGLTVVKPEIIGGNGAITYNYQVGSGAVVDGGALSKNGGGTVSGTTDDVVTGSITLPVSAFIGTTNGEDKDLIPDGDLSEFKFTFGDSTPGTSLEDTAGKNSASMTVFLDVHLRETTKAKNWILPFYWKSKTDNSLFKQSADEGHIELAKDWVTTTSYAGTSGEYDDDPKVSGKIKIEGIARDDTLLNEIKVEFGTSMGGLGTTNTTIASYDAAGASWNVTPFVEITDAETSAVLGYKINEETGWASEIQQATYQDLKDVGLISAIPDDKEATSKVPYTSQDYGHVVHWTLYLDTALVEDTAATDVTVTATATDRGKPKWNASANEGNGGVDYNANTAFVTGDTEGENETIIPAANSGAVTKSGDNVKIGTRTGRYRMDVVPYITKLYTGISDTAGEEFARSATGKYIVRGKYLTGSKGSWTANTETVRIFGFNLKADSTTGNVTIGSTNNIKTTASNAADTTKYGAHLTFPVGTGTSSGKLSITVNSVTSLNNINASPTFADGATEASEGSSAMYNSQTNGKTNDRLTDDVDLWVWDMNYFLDETDITSPMMKMDKSGNYYMSYGYGVPSMYVNKNGTERQIDYGYNKFHNTNVLFDDNGYLYAVATSTDRVVNDSSRFVFYTPNTDSMPDLNNTTDKYEYEYRRTSKRHLELAYNTDTGVYNINRVKRPKLSSYTVGNDTYLAVAYFDYNNSSSPVKFRFGKRSDYSSTGYSYQFTYNNTQRKFAAGNNANLDGTLYVLINGTYHLLTKTQTGNYNNRKYWYTISDYNSTEGFTSYTYTHTTSLTGGIMSNVSEDGRKTDSPTYDCSADGYHTIADKNTGFKGGEYTAVGIVPSSDGTNGYIGVVAWYDASVRKVCYSYNTNPDTVNNDVWQTNAIYLDSDQYTGWYVDLAVDDGGGIHIAYYNSAKGDLKYVYLSSYDADPTDPITIDSYLSVGTNITVNTRLENGKYVPYIYYYNTSSNQTPNSIKVAWREDMTTLRDGAINDKFTGAWESMTIPTVNIPSDATVCGGVPSASTTAADNKTVFLGYMSDVYYEKATIKGDVTQ